MTLKQDGPIFFFSYARNDADEHLGRFFQEIREEVRGLMGLSASHPVGFRDTHGIKTGDRWPEELSSALSTCQILLPLYSRSFFNSEYCGKEWSAFRSRLDSHGSNPKLILPILWKPLGASFETLPKEFREIQYSFDDLGETYRNEGLQYLLRLDEQKDTYQKFLVAFAKRIVDASESSPFEPAVPPLDIEKFPNAFTEPEPAPVIETTTVRSSKRTRGYYMPKASKDLEPSFIEIRDDFLARVERVCRLREPAAQIERISGEGDFWDYLRVSVRHGDIVRDYPVAGVEYDVSLEDLNAFRERIDKGFRAADPRMISYLIYGGAPAPEGLQKVASNRDVRLMSLIEYMGLIDFRGYLRRQTEELTRDKLYPPSLYVTQRMVSLERNEEHPDALAKLQEWLSTPNRRFAVILGDFGTGKTFLLHELARRMGLLESGPVPILLQMRSLEKGRTLAQLLGQHFGQNEPEGYRFERFRYMLEQGRIVLLFDGFDELALRVTYDRAAEHFETLLSAAQGDAKIVVTSRRQHFLSDQQVRSKLGEEVELISGSRIGILQTFSRDQIRAFLGNRCGSEAEADTRLNLIDSIKDLLGLSENPRMLGFIADLPEVQLCEAAAGGVITAATLYRLILERWLVHEFERVHPKGAPPGLSVQDRWNAVTLLAVRLWQKTDRYVNLEEIQADAAEAIQKIDRVFDEAIAAFQVGSGTLLVRDDEGNFSFLHQSILEFLVAQAAAEGLKKEGISSLLGEKDLSLLMIDFLTSFTGRENIVAWARQTTRGNDDIPKKNALLVLDRLQEKLDQAIDLSGQNLTGQDLSDQNLENANLERTNLSSAKLIRTRLHRARLVYANLRDADLTRADLSQTDLAHANLTRARLLGADLRGTDLGYAIFERAKLIGASLDEKSDSADFFGSALRIPDAPEGMTLFSSPSSAVAWNPKRDLLASAEGGLIRLWDPSSGQLIRAFQGHQGAVNSVVFSPEGNTLASASDDKTVRLWDTASGREMRAFQGHLGRVNSVVFNPEGNTLASASDDKTVRLWDTASGREIRAFQGHLGGSLSVVFSPTGNTLASTSYDNTVHLWDTTSGRKIRTFRGHQDWVRSVVFSPEGNTLASASDDKTVRLWDTASGREIRNFQGHLAPVNSVTFSPNGNILASASDDKTVRLWDTASGVEILTFRGHYWYVRSVAFSPGGNTLASASNDSTLRLWDIASGREIRVFQGDERGVRSMAFTLKGNTLASASDDHTIHLWDVASGQEIRAFQVRQDWVMSVAFNPEGNTLASAFDDHTVRLWDTASGKEIRALQGHQSVVRSVAFSPNGKNLASASDDKTVRLWDIALGREIQTFQGHHGGVSSVAFSPNGKNLASASYDKTVRLWDIASGREMQTFQRHEGHVYSVVFSPEGNTLASASDDKTVRLWEIASGREVRTFQGHQEGVNSVVFSPEGNTLASASDDKTVRLWDTASGRESQAFQGHQGGVSSVVFSPEGNTLASASFDNTVRLWDVATGRCIVILVHLPEGWVAFAPDGRYKYGGVIAGGFWHAINLCRFEVGELDEFVPGLRLPDDASFFDLPPVPPWVQAKA